MSSPVIPDQFRTLGLRAPRRWGRITADAKFLSACRCGALVSVIFATWWLADERNRVEPLVAFAGAVVAYVLLEFRGCLEQCSPTTIPCPDVYDPIARGLITLLRTEYKEAVSSCEKGEIAYRGNANDMLNTLSSSIQLATTDIRTVFHVGGLISVSIWTSRWRRYVERLGDWKRSRPSRYAGRLFIIPHNWMPTDADLQALIAALDFNVAQDIDIYCYFPSLAADQPGRALRQDMVLVDSARAHLLSGHDTSTGHTSGILVFEPEGVAAYVRHWEEVRDSSMSYQWSDDSRKLAFLSLVKDRLDRTA